MDESLRFSYFILIFISGIAIFFAPFGLIFSFKNFKTMHFNLKFLIFIFGILACFLPTGGMYFFFIIDSIEVLPNLYQLLDYQIAKNICAISGFSFRMTETSICIERLIATVFFKSYEKNKIFRIYPFLAIFIIFTLAFTFLFLFNIIHVPVIVDFTFLISVELINFCLLYILKKQNHKLRKLSNSRHILLSSKYQLIENIKSLNLLFPQATISFFISNFSIAQAIIVREFFIEGIEAPIYFALYCINIIIISIYWIYRSAWFRIKLTKFRYLKSNKIHNAIEIMPYKPITVKTALGQTVKAQQTAEEYFKGLKNAWN